MPEGAKTLLVILFIPFLFALGHDTYISYFSDDDKIRDTKALRINSEDFMISDAGWIWNNYASGSMETMRMSFEPSTWESKIDPLLQLPTMIVSLIPWAATFIYLIISWVLGIWPCVGRQISFGRRRKKDDFAVYKHAKVKSTKYKR